METEVKTKIIYSLMYFGSNPPYPNQDERLELVETNSQSDMVSFDNGVNVTWISHRVHDFYNEMFISVAIGKPFFIDRKWGDRGIMYKIRAKEEIEG